MKLLDAVDKSYRLHCNDTTYKIRRNMPWGDPWNDVIVHIRYNDTFIKFTVGILENGKKKDFDFFLKDGKGKYIYNEKTRKKRKLDYMSFDKEGNPIDTHYGMITTSKIENVEGMIMHYLNNTDTIYEYDNFDYKAIEDNEFDWSKYTMLALMI